jgi:hypothetical protein
LSYIVYSYVFPFSPLEGGDGGKNDK